MKNLFTQVLCYCLFVFSANAQTNLSYAWSKGFPNSQILGSNTEAFSIATDAVGNSYVIGIYQNTVDMDPGAGVVNLTSTGSTDIYFGKYDASGALVFAKNIGGMGNDNGNKIRIDGSGNIYITGAFTGTSDFDPSANTANLTSAGLSDFFLAKYDANGNYVYAIAFGAANNDEGTCIDFDAANNVYVGGRFQNTVDFDPGAGTANLTSAGSTDIFIAKYDAYGNYVFAKAIGGTSFEVINGIALDASNNIYISGYIQSLTDFDPGAGTANLNTAGVYDIYIAKYDVSGNYVFAKAIGGTDYDQSNGIDVDAAGNIYITGWFRSPTVDFDPGAGTANLSPVGNDDGFIAKYSASGNYLYAGVIGGTQWEEGSEIIVDASNYVYVIGTFGTNVDFDPGAGTAIRSSPSGYGIFIAKYDANINYQFVVGVGASMRGNDLSVDGSGNVYAAGMFNTVVDFDPGAPTVNLTPPGLQNGFIASYNNTGSYRFAKQIGGYFNTTYSELGNAITTDAAGNIYVTGLFAGNVDFDPGPGTTLLSGAAGGDIFFAKYDANGNFVFAKALSGGTKEPKNIALDASGNIYIAGYFQSNLDVDPGAAYVGLTSAGSDDIFFAKYDVNGNYVYAKQIGGTGSDRANTMVLDGSGNIYIAGNFTGTVDFDPGAAVANLSGAGGSQDIFFAKYDAAGNYMYAKGTGGTGFDAADAICLDASGNICITGRFQTTADFDPSAATVNLISAGNYDIFIAKYNTTGAYVYAKRMGGTSDDQPTAMTIDGSNNIYITGAYQGTADFDPGAPLVNLVSIGSYEIFFAKYDASGNYLYAKSFSGSGFDFGRSIIVDNSNNVYVVGEFANSIDLDAGGGTASFTAVGGGDFFITKYDATGNYVYAKTMGGASGSDNCWDIVKDAGGNLVITGRYGSVADFDPNANTATQTALNSLDFFIAKYTECSGPIMASYSMRAAAITVSGATTLTDGGCSLLSTITPSGATPVTGVINGKVWIEASVPVYGGQPYVARHYEITPSTNPTTATAKVTLYFTQQEFDNFNAHSGSLLDLPANPSDASGISNLKIGKYSGSSNNGSGQPNSYTGFAQIIDPNDADIIWNNLLNRWEVSFDVSGFSGFIVQTHGNLLPLTLLEFKGQLISNSALLTWKTESEKNTSHFDIERSKDGKSFSQAGRVKSSNNPATQRYQFTDQNINSLNVPVVYYRLKQTDIDGRSTYSETIALSINLKEGIVMLRPNPVQNATTLMITATQKQSIVYRIIDNSGRIIRSVDVTLRAGSNIIPINTNDLSTGVYVVDIRGAVTNGQVRLLKL